MRIVGVASKRDLRKSGLQSPGRNDAASSGTGAISGELSLVRQHAFDDDYTDGTSSTLVTGITRGNTLIQSTTTAGTTRTTRLREQLQTPVTPISALTGETYGDLYEPQENHAWRTDRRKNGPKGPNATRTILAKSNADPKSMKEIVKKKIDQRLEEIKQVSSSTNSSSVRHEEEKSSKSSEVIKATQVMAKRVSTKERVSKRTQGKTSPTLVVTTTRTTTAVQKEREKPIRNPSNTELAPPEKADKERRKTNDSGKSERKERKVNGSERKERKVNGSERKERKVSATGSDTRRELLASPTTDSKDSSLDITQDSRSAFPNISATESTGASSGGADAITNEESDTTKVKMTKIEKIKQLQAKNEKYKEEYKKIYGEKKELKKKLEEKRLEVVSLHKEIDTYVDDTANLQKQLIAANRQIEEKSQNDVAVVAKLEKDLELTREELKEALGRVADRKLEVDRLRESMVNKDEQIESLSCEVAAQIEEVQHLQARLSIVDNVSPADQASTTTQGMTMDNLLEENEVIKAELSMTLERVSEMVKERDHEIDTLQKENEALTQLMDIRDSSGKPRDETAVALKEREQEIMELGDQLEALKKECAQVEQSKEGVAAELEQRETALRELMTEYEELEARVVRAEKTSKRTKGLLDHTESSLGEMRQQVEQLRGSQLATARELEEATELIKERDDAIADLLGEYEALKREPVASVADLEREHEKVQLQEEEIKKLLAQREALQKEFDQQKAELEDRQGELEAHVAVLKQEKSELEVRMTQSAQALEAREVAIQNLSKEMDGLKQEQMQSDSERAKAEGDREASVINYLREIDNLKLEMDRVNRELELARTMIKERETALEDLLTEIDQMKQQQRSEAENEEATTSELSTQLQEKEASLLELHEAMNGLAKQHEATTREVGHKAEMVKEREEVIEELLKEIEGLKKQQNHITLELGEASDLAEERAEEIARLAQEKEELKKQSLQGEGEMGRMERDMESLRAELSDLQGALEDLQRDNAILNEEIEERELRGGDMETTIQKLENEIEALKEQAISAAPSTDAADQQALFLEKAMANRRKKEENSGGGWLGYAAKLLTTGSEEEEELDPNQRRIKELEAQQEAKDKEMEALKRELIQLQTTYREESYVSKKKIESLQVENDALQAKFRTS